MLVFTYGHISFLVRITRLCSMKLGFRKLKAEVPSGVFCDFLITSGSLAHYAWWKSSVNKLTLGVARGVANFKQHVMNPAALILAKSLTQRQRSPKIRIEHSRSGCKITIPQKRSYFRCEFIFPYPAQFSKSASYLRTHVFILLNFGALYNSF